MSRYHSDLRRLLTTSTGEPLPYYLVPFDKHGNSRSDPLINALLNDLETNRYSHVIIFSHGWNNTWDVANARYDDFIQGVAKLRRDFNLPPSGGGNQFKPLLVGIFWPSTALAFGSDEVGPNVELQALGGNPAALGESVLIDDIASALSSADASRFYALAVRDRLSMDEASELANLLVGQIAYDDEESIAIQDAAPLLPDELLQIWGDVQVAERDVTWGGVELPQIKAQGLPSFLDPRWLIRILSVHRMKRRAGLVGEKGGALLLQQISKATEARLHLIGHSYGAKLLLSAVANMPKPTANAGFIHSLLLLHGALSNLSFAEQVPGSAQPGRYHGVLDRVIQPVLTTYSSRDFSLHRIYHWTFRRKGDLGDIAKFADPSCDRYAALGGYGPRHSQERNIALPAYPAPIPPLNDKVRLFGLDGSANISGHGDVSNYATWWLLYQQLGQS